MALTPQLQSLIDKLDNRELVRDQVAAIIKVESDAQVRLAPPLGRDPYLWQLRVFTERSSPWAAFSDTPDGKRPIVNVWAESSTFEKPRSNVISSQTAVGTVHVDCYGFGVAEETIGGHDAADLVAAREAERSVRLCRNILMSGFYTYLGFPQQKFLPEGKKQVCFGRWVSSITSFQPVSSERPVERVAAIRLDLEVTYEEHGPEYIGQPLEILAVSLTKTPDGEWIAPQYNLAGS